MYTLEEFPPRRDPKNASGKDRKSRRKRAKRGEARENPEYVAGAAIPAAAATPPQPVAEKKAQPMTAGPPRPPVEPKPQPGSRAKPQPVADGQMKPAGGPKSQPVTSGQAKPAAAQKPQSATGAKAAPPPLQPSSKPVASPPPPSPLPVRATPSAPVWKGRSGGDQTGDGGAGYTRDDSPAWSESRESRSIGVGLLPIIAVLAIGASAGGAGAFFWAERRVNGLEGALNDARTELETAHSSLRTLWATTQSLDEARGRRQDFLRDTLASVQQFVDTEVNRLWQTAYVENRRRLDTGDARIASNAQSIELLFDQSATTSSRIDALFRENEVQYTGLSELGQSVAAVRQTLAAIASQVGDLQTQFAATRLARGQLDRRIGGVERWVDEFTTAGLDGDAVQQRLASLVDELEIMTARVDSLQAVTDSVRRSRRALVGQEDRPR